MAEVCVIGGGPAGSTFAVRMAQLGHSVCLIERMLFPRSHLGESLSPGVLPLLESTGARQLVEGVGFSRVRTVDVDWGGDPQVRTDPDEQGMLADRGLFDFLLLQHARSFGVRVLQPARVLGWRRDRESWLVEVERKGSAAQIRTDLIADASGRSSGLNARHRRRTGTRTVALYRYSQGNGLPEHPRIEARADSWYWGVPLPDGWYNTLLFADADRFRGSPPASLESRFVELLGNSGLDGRGSTPLHSAVRVADATPFLCHDPVEPAMIRVGEAALGIDPVSSSGVQKSIQTALAGAVTANTLLRRPESAQIAMDFYRSMLADASGRHCRWAAEHYSTVAAQYGTTFWKRRAAGPADQISNRRAATDANALMAKRLTLSSAIEIRDVPCLQGDFVAVRSALRHPNLETCVTFVGGCEIVPLLRRVTGSATLPEILVSWLDRVPPRTGVMVAKWLLSNGILVDEALPGTRVLS